MQTTFNILSVDNISGHIYALTDINIYPTPPLGQDMTQGQFLSGI